MGTGPQPFFAWALHITGGGCKNALAKGMNMDFNVLFLADEQACMCVALRDGAMPACQCGR